MYPKVFMNDAVSNLVRCVVDGDHVLCDDDLTLEVPRSSVGKSRMKDKIVHLTTVTSQCGTPQYDRVVRDFKRY